MQSTASASSDDDNIYSDESEETTPRGYKHNRKFKLNNKKHRRNDDAEQPQAYNGCCYFV